jgi:hypothetical protein
LADLCAMTRTRDGAVFVSAWFGGHTEAFRQIAQIEDTHSLSVCKTHEF